MQGKNILQSKTFWANVLAIGTTFYPPVGAVVAAYPGGAIGLLGGINVVLRLISSGKVTLS